MPLRKANFKQNINDISGAPRYHSLGGNILRRSTTRPQETVYTNRNAPHYQKNYNPF